MFCLFFQILCQLNEYLVSQLERLFVDNYLAVDGYNLREIRNVSTYFGHLLSTDTINWDVLSIIQLNRDIYVKSRVYFIKFMFYYIIDHIGYKKLTDRINSE